MPEKIKTLKIDPNKCLRNDLTTAETENLIFVSSSDSTNNQPKRLLFHKPFQPFKYIYRYIYFSNRLLFHTKNNGYEKWVSHSFIRIYPVCQKETCLKCGVLGNKNNPLVI